MEYGDGEGQGQYFQLDGLGRLLGGGDNCSAAPGPELFNALTYIPLPAFNEITVKPQNQATAGLHHTIPQGRPEATGEF